MYFFGPFLHCRAVSLSATSEAPVGWKKPNQQIQRHGGTFPSSVPWDRSWQFPRNQKQMRCSPRNQHETTICYMAGGQPLSVTPPADLDHAEVDAYSICRRLESWDVWPLALIQSDDIPEPQPAPAFVDVNIGPTVCVRLQAQMLLQALTPDGRRNMANEILGCKTTNCPSELDLPTMEKLTRLRSFTSRFSSEFVSNI